MTDLTKNTLAFGLMTPEDQEALKAWPHGWEVFTGPQWVNADDPMWILSNTYRAKPAPVAETRVLYGNPSSPGWVYTTGRCETDTHCLTFDVVGGEPVPGSEKWERFDD